MPPVTDPAVDRPVVTDAEAYVWSLEFTADDASFAGATGVTWDPSAALRRFFLHLFVPDGVVVVRDDAVAAPQHGRVCDGRADALWFSYICETPLDHWSLGVEAFGLRAVDGDDLLPVGRPATAPFEEVGERIPVGIEIEFEADTPGRGDGVTHGFDQRGRVHGDLLVGTDVHPVDVRALRRVRRGAAPDVSAPRPTVTSVDDVGVPDDVGQRVHVVPVPVVTADGSRELWRRVLLRLDPDAGGRPRAGFRFGPTDRRPEST